MNDIIIFGILLLLSGFFSGTETAFTSITEYALASNYFSEKKKLLLKKLINDKQSVIAALLVGNNIVNTVLAVYAGVVADKMLVETKILPESAGPVVASVVSVVFLLIFGEVLPKQFGVAFTKGWCSIAAYPINFLVFILKPITIAMNWLSKSVMKILPVKATDDAPTVDELMMMAENSEKAGNIDNMEKNLMYSSSQINDLTAADVMIPKNKIIAVKSDVKPNELLKIFKTHLYSRIPVYDSSIDEIKGIFNIKECLKLKESQLNNFDIKKHWIEPIYVPGNVKIGSLMEQMKDTRKHMAVVVSEYGITDGIVTLENILERIIGLIGDEYDDEEDTVSLAKTLDEDINLEIPGTSSLQDISKIIMTEFPTNAHHKINTINGLLTDLKGDFLEKGDEFDLSDFNFKVLSVKTRCAEKILITKRTSKGN